MGIVGVRLSSLAAKFELGVEVFERSLFARSDAEKVGGKERRGEVIVDDGRLSDPVAHSGATVVVVLFLSVSPRAEQLALSDGGHAERFASPIPSSHRYTNAFTSIIGRVVPGSALPACLGALSAAAAVVVSSSPNR